MWSICKRMKWAHLPEPGGLLDQSPDLFVYFPIIWNVESEIQQEEADKAKRNKGGRGGSRNQFKKSTI